MNKEQLQHDKTSAEIAFLMAQTAKVNKEIRWFDVGVIVAATLAVVAVAKMFL